MNFTRVFPIATLICVVACGGPPANDESGPTDETTVTLGTSEFDTSDTPDTGDGDGDTGDTEPDGPGAIEWSFVNDGGIASAIAVDEGERAIVGGCCTNPWLARFEPDGTPAWQLADMGGPMRTVSDVALDGQGRVIVVGREGDDMSGEAWIAAHELEDGAESWSLVQPSMHGFGSSSSAVAVLGDTIHVAIDSPTGGLLREPSITSFDLEGVAGVMRTWPIGYGSVVSALAVDPGAMQLVLVGAEDLGNWIEAIDGDSETLWTANDAVAPSPGDGSARVQNVAIDSAGFVYVVGEESYNDGQSIEITSYVRRLSGDGQADWTVTELPGNDERVVAVADDVVYVVGSQSGVGIWLVARSVADGELIWEHHIPREPDGPDRIYDLAVGPGSLWMAGGRLGDGGTQQAYVARVTR
jgi:hypothetical protein